jgi:hypothetical protein
MAADGKTLLGLVGIVLAAVGQTDALVINTVASAVDYRSAAKAMRRLDWERHSASLQQRGRFRRYYRMPLGTFRQLAGGLKVGEGRWHERRQFSSAANAPLSAELRLSMTLRFLAGGSYMDIAIIHGCDFDTVYPVVERTLHALDQLPLLDNMHFERDIASPSARVALAAAFAKISAGVLVGCLGALDGLLIPIECPRWGRDFGPAMPAFNPLSYYCRKGFYAVNVQACAFAERLFVDRPPPTLPHVLALWQAICDAYCRFTYASIQTPGTTHDSLAFSLSGVHDTLTRGTLAEQLARENYYIVVDQAYTVTPTTMGPWYGDSLEANKDTFNYYQSRTR